MLTEMQKKLAAIDHFVKYPAMIPFIGEYYQSPKHKKLLLIGESFYLPNETTVHHSPEMWYKSDQSCLSKDEIEWINCNSLLTGPWDPTKGHKMYINLDNAIKSLEVETEKRAIDEIAFVNYFQRPAVGAGNSFKNCCEPKDKNISFDVMKQIITILDPDVIIIVSKYSWDAGGKQLKVIFPNKNIDFTCHPVSSNKNWWDNKSYPHGKEKFIKLLKENFIL